MGLIAALVLAALALVAGAVLTDVALFDHSAALLALGLATAVALTLLMLGIVFGRHLLFGRRPSRWSRFN